MLKIGDKVMTKENLHRAKKGIIYAIKRIYAYCWGKSNNNHKLANFCKNICPGLIMLSCSQGQLNLNYTYFGIRNINFLLINTKSQQRKDRF